MKKVNILAAILCGNLLLTSCGGGGISEETIDSLLDQYFLYEKYVRRGSSSMPVDYSQMDAEYYCPVTDENYDTWAEWTAFLEGIFCGAALDKAMEKVSWSYKEVDGMTYCVQADVGWYLSSEPTSVTIEEESDTEATLIVARYEMFEEADVPVNYILHKTDNGWRIADIENSLHYDLP